MGKTCTLCWLTQSAGIDSVMYINSRFLDKSPLYINVVILIND